MKSILKNLTRLSLLLMVLLGLTWFPSCKDDPFEYQIERASALSFRLDTFDIVTTTEVTFSLGPKVLHTFEDSTQVLFQRISFEAHGFTAKENEYWLVIDFDTHADGNAVGLYRCVYDKEDGGISDMRLIIKDNGDFIVFKAIGGTNDVFFQVDAQRPEERIMKGIFGGVLYQDGIPENMPVYLFDGIFKDIYY